MDTSKSSHSSKGPELSDVMAPEELAPGDRQPDEENETDTDTPDGILAVTPASHRMAREKHRYHTISHQQLVTYINNQKKSRGMDFSTVRGPSTSARPRGALMQVIFSQGAPEKSVAQEDRGGAQAQVDTLKLVLDTFTAPSDLRWTWGEGGTETALEQSWTDIVESHASMSKTERHQQEALWELINTELTYINKLTIAKDLVLAALSHCRGYGFLQEVSPTMLFSTLPLILDAHRLFWQEVMYPMLQEVRHTGRPFDPLKLEPGCFQFNERFSAYFEYCWDEERNVEFTRRQLETNPQFHTFLSWVENHPQCGRMRLGDMQAKPHQRITKYPLLLKAVQKNTEDLPTQNALDRMLNSVNDFLASINDYLQFKLDEQALYDAAQRIEGYKLEGLSEEIDKHVREFSCFDLTSTIRGVGPEIIRKQLLEETLKVRGRKDNKELVVLLFTDVLLMTKTEKKSDRLKVVRPPLPLERIRCSELKDGYSFVLVEVGDLGCAVSVYCLSTPSPDSCSVWVSALREAQTVLFTLRTNEENKTLKTTNDTNSGSERSPTQNQLTNKVKEDSNGQSESDSDFPPLIEPYLKQMDKVSVNGTQTINDVEQSEDQQVMEGKRSPLIGQQNRQSQTANGGVAEIKKSGSTESNELKTEGRNRNNSKQWEEGEASLRKFAERRVTWNHGPRPSSTSNDITQQNQSNGPQTLLPGRHIEENGTPGQSTQSTLSNESLVNKTQHEKTVQLNTNNGPQDQEIRRDSLCSQSEEDNQILTGSNKFLRNFESPRLRKKRPNSLQPSVPFNSSRIGSSAKEPLECTPNITSDDNARRASNASIKSQETHRVLKLGSLKNNHGMFWHDKEERSSPDPKTLSDGEKRTNGNLQTKPKLKTQRSASISEISFPHTSSLPAHRLNPSPPPGLDPQVYPSPLQELLQRAKEREKEHGLGKRERRANKRTFSLQNSPTFSIFPSTSEGERVDKVLESFVRSRQRQDEMKKSNKTSEGIGVDWPGWCFDDEDVFDFQDFDDDNWLGKKQTPPNLRREGQKPSRRHDDGECSEV